MAVEAECETQAAPDERWHDRTFRATAFDEMEILQYAGRDGCELLDVGPYALYCRRRGDHSKVGRWEYIRRVGIHRSGIVEDMLADRWQPCGQWVMFHYFKREIIEG